MKTRHIEPEDPPDVQLRRFLREAVLADWQELRAAKSPTDGFREQRRRERRRIQRAREHNVVCWRPAHWLGRRPSQVERLALLAALDWFNTGNRCIARVGTGRLKEVQLTGMVNPDFKGPPA